MGQLKYPNMILSMVDWSQRALARFRIAARRRGSALDPDKSEIDEKDLPETVQELVQLYKSNIAAADSATSLVADWLPMSWHRIKGPIADFYQIKGPITADDFGGSDHPMGADEPKQQAGYRTLDVVVLKQDERPISSLDYCWVGSPKREYREKRTYREVDPKDIGLAELLYKYHNQTKDRRFDGRKFLSKGLYEGAIRICRYVLAEGENYSQRFLNVMFNFSRPTPIASRRGTKRMVKNANVVWYKIALDKKDKPKAVERVQYI
ncbi:hypothetical protein KY360_07495 [Candidatus Woesearchaeota archaeon]|nr:hypothetical protein [Candidatus Woesearchaeota archaeon]